MDKIIEILREHEVFEVDIPDKYSRNNALHDLAVRIDHLYSPDISEEEIDELCPWDKELFPINYEKWCEGFKAALSKLKPRDELIPQKGVIEHDGMIYWFEYKLAKDGNLCLATKNPYRYCNGTYAFSSKDPGTGKAFVIINYRQLKPIEVSRACRWCILGRWKSDISRRI